MQDLAFIVLTVVVFAVIGLVAKGGGAAVSVENVVGLVVAVALVGYLVVALILPEKF